MGMLLKYDNYDISKIINEIGCPQNDFKNEDQYIHSHFSFKTF